MTFLIALFSLILSGCGDVEFLTTGAGVEAEEQSITVKKPQMVSYREGGKDKIIAAAEGKFLEKSQRLELSDVEIDLFDRGDLAAELSAQHGVLFLQDNEEMERKKNDFLLQKNVVYENVDGSIFKTDSLVWKDEEEKFVSDAPFYMEQKTDEGVLIVEGKQLETDKNLKNWKKEGAKIQLIPKE